MTSIADESLHHSHPEVISRLKRAEGHLRSVIAMMEAKRSCTDIAQQLSAVEKAVANAKAMMIRDHIEHCLDGAATTPEARALLDELKAVVKYL
ncbi:metal-sensing transcriptional repressor [Lacibacterium aquatile]|uniref:Metal-sensing transcriptional repressor n=1 Tax=Lacibacterium aquatile TaxID=1168082 RepID=A0ABW5DQY0_9PROT